MQNEYKFKFPWWANSICNYDLCLSNDIDSLFSCKILEKIKGWKIKYFYDFNILYRTQNTENKAIAVDVDLMQGKCWGNHVTPAINENAANLNVVDKITNRNYHYKYAGNTLLQVWSYYKLPLPESKEAKMILLAIDSFYLGYYSLKFHNTFLKYLEILEYIELIDVLDKHTLYDFDEIKQKYNLNGKIWVENNKLATDIKLDELSKVFDIDLSLPKDEFYPWKKFEVRNQKYKNLPENVFSAALVRKNFIKYSILQ